MKSFLITGASTGIGRACAEHLASQGHRVFAGVRKEKDANELTASSEAIEPVILDVADGDSIETAVSEISGRAGGRLDGLVNNAGITVQGPLEFLPIEELRSQFEVNVIGQIAVTQACLPMLREATGRIVFMSSIAGRTPAFPLLGPYSSSKAALEALADALRIELKGTGMSVSVIEPGSIATPIWEKGESNIERSLANYPEIAMERYGEAMEKARKVAAASGKRGIPASIVAERVDHALTSSRPRFRYLVGNDARLRAVIEPPIPDAIRDRIIARYLGLDARQ